MKNILFLLLAFSLILSAAPVTLVRKGISEAVEVAARKSGKTLSPVMRKTFEESLLRASKQYGDDALKAVTHGGLEVFEQGGKHGEVFWKLCAHSPQGARALALHADELMPIACRLGKDFVSLEAHMPGMGKKAVECFGDDVVKILLKMPKEEASMLVKYAARADSPETAALLLEKCQKTGGKILHRLDGKVIVATGITASMILSAYKVSDGIEEAITEVAKNSPENFVGVVSRPITILASVFAVLLLGMAYPVWKWLCRRFCRQSAGGNDPA